MYWEAEIKWREEVWYGVTGHDCNPASGLTCSGHAFMSLCFSFSFQTVKWDDDDDDYYYFACVPGMLRELVNGYQASKSGK